MQERGVRLGVWRWSLGLLVAGAALGCAGADTTSGGNPSVVGPTAGATGGVAGMTSNVPVAGTGGGGAGTGGGMAPAALGLPCNVQTVLQNNCQSCHGATRIGGAPMSLLTHADLTRDYTVATTTGMTGQTMKMYELVKIRINREMGTSPMPQGAPMSPADLSALNDWIAMGAPAGSECGNQSTGGVSGGAGMNGGAGMGAAGMGGPPGNNSECEGDAAYEPLVPRDGETCYELLTHGEQTLAAGATKDSVSPYMIQPGENYEQFYFRVPWAGQQVQGTRFGAKFDNLPVLHHWLLFSSARPESAHGTHETVIGTVGGDDAQLLGGWAVGGCNVEFPPEMGLQLPSSGILNVQWHYYNSTGTPQGDRSAVQICTVPAGTRPNTGSLTWLGTEDFFGPLGMPPGQHEFSGTCPNDSNGPITIWGFWPHMHELGIHMKSVVNRADGTTEPVFDKPFDFNYQIHYVNSPAVVLQPGDTITSTCTFNNTTAGNVAFGPSTNQEMCYQFAFSYPAGALDKPTLSLIGATNVCW